MEEILASIRRIISEDEPSAEAAPEAEAEAAEPQPEPEPEPVKAEEVAPPPAPEPEPVEEVEDEPLELTQKVETLGDLDVMESPPAPEPEPVYAPPPVPEATLVSAPAAMAAGAAFDKLSAVIAMPAEGRTLEDVVRELLRPQLQQWLDDNLPKIVSEAVEAEVARIARGRVR